MHQVLTRKLLLSLSLPLAGLLILTSAAGLFYPGIYSGATLSWELQTIGQDGVDLLLIAPILIISTIYSCKRGRVALAVWAGTNIYIAYTFVIYCFDVRFNSFFVFYCSILGLALFSTGLFFYKTVKEGHAVLVGSLTRKLVGYFLIVLSAVFYFTWLSDIVPAIVRGELPAAVQETGLPTNPVHVLDLAILLPLVFIVGILTLKGNSFALSLAPSLLVFFILMDITIAVLALILFRGGVAESYSVSIIMGSHAIVSVGALIMFLNRTV